MSKNDQAHCTVFSTKALTESLAANVPVDRRRAPYVSEGARTLAVGTSRISLDSHMDLFSLCAKESNPIIGNESLMSTMYILSLVCVVNLIAKAFVET